MDDQMLVEDALIQPQLDLRSIIMKIDNELHDDDVDNLKFLCLGLLIGSKLKRVDNALELIDLLESAGHVSASDYFILADLLQIICRLDVLESIGFTEEEVLYRRQQCGSRVDPFYVLLFRISEEMTKEDVKKAAHQFGKMPQSKKLEKGTDLFTVMCQRQAITPNNINLLLDIFTSLKRNDIVQMIRKYLAETIGSNPSSGNMFPTQIGIIPMEGMGHMSGDISVSIGRNAAQFPPLPQFQHLSPSSFIPNSSLQIINPNSAFHISQDPKFRPQQQNATMEGILTDKMAFQAALETEILPLEFVKELAVFIPVEYWQEFFNKLGVQIETTSVSNAAQQQQYRFYVAVIRWLSLPETKKLDPVLARTKFVLALLHAGPALLAQNVAEHLNIDLQSVMQDSMESPVGDLVNIKNETASTGSATEEEPQVAPVTHQMQHLSLNQATPSSSPLRYYKMNANPVGVCLIINNRYFTKDPEDENAKLMPEREGTDSDRDKLKDVFQHLKFKVYTCENLTNTQMVEAIESCARMDHTEYDCFVCCILTHGVLGELYGINGRTVPISTLTAPLRPQYCPTLRGKPKLFFLQACQGREKQPGYPDIQSDGIPETDSPQEADGRRKLIPSEADFLIGYATVPGFVSYRSKTQGSWFINKLTELLKKYAYDHDILDILTLVNYEVGRANAEMPEGVFKQSPAPLYSLRKKVVFNHPGQ